MHPQGTRRPTSKILAEQWFTFHAVVSLSTTIALHAVFPSKYTIVIIFFCNEQYNLFFIGYVPVVSSRRQAPTPAAPTWSRLRCSSAEDRREGSVAVKVKARSKQGSLAEVVQYMRRQIMVLLYHGTRFVRVSSLPPPAPFPEMPQTLQ